MKQNLRLLLLTLLCAVVTGVWGQVTVAKGTFNGKNNLITQGWSSTGTGLSREDCIVIGAGENITSPALNLSGYTKVKITFQARRFGTLTGSKATVDASIGNTSMGTIDITIGSVGDVPGSIEFEPTPDMTAAKLVFTCTNATSPGSTHGAGIGTITILGYDGTETKAPVFSPEPGAVVAGTTITCATETEDATIYYTTDGSTPDEDSDEFPAAGVKITENTTFKAIAIDAAGNSSEVTTAAYTIKVTSLTTVSNKTWVFGADQNNADYTTNNIVDNMEVCAGVTKGKKNAGYLEIDGTMATTRLQVAVDKWLHVKVAAGSRVTFYVSSSGSAARTVNITTDAEGTDILGTLNIEKGSDNYKPYYYDYSGTTDKDIYFYVASGGQCHVVGAKVAPIPDIAAPTFDPEGGEYTEAQSVTISCATEDVDIFYTLDGTDPTDESDLYSGAITISETATLKAIAYNADGESSEVTSATYTITAPATAANIAEFKALDDGTVATLTLTNAQVLFAQGNNIIVADASGGIVFFKTNLGYKQWDVLNGTIKAEYSLYNGIPELTAVEESNITVTVGEETEPTEFVATDAIEANICRYYTKMSEVKLAAGSNAKSFTATLPDGSTFAVYNQLGVELTTPTEGTAYNVYGVLGRYNKNFQFWPIADFEVAETKADPELAFDPTTVNLNVGETANVTFSKPNDLVVEFINEDETVATYANGVVTALKAGTTTITATSEETELYNAGEAVLTITVTDGSATDENYFVKVTSDEDLTDGTYLIVYEDGSLAFDGSLATLDVAKNTIPVTISDDKIPRTQATDAATFEIDVDAGTIYSKSGYYIGKLSDGNGMDTSDEEAYTNEISIDEDGNANIMSGNAYLRYNATSGQERFRYFRRATYTAQKAIQLYKLVEPEDASIMVDITPVGYATLYYSDKSLIVPEGVVAKMYGLNSDNELIEITPFIEEGDVIPAGCGVVLEATTPLEKTTSFEFVVDNNGDTYTDNGNLLYGSDEPTMTNEIVEGNNLYYVLSTDKNGENVGFYWGAKKGAAFENGAHKAFLAIPKSSGVNASSFVFDELTGIRAITVDSTEGAEGVYTLSGMRIDGKQLPKGIYIVNGKKMVIK
ncbi:MAG: chitobiase/beta-hexosaminidase C-terminal domain-containing protein [Prevotella sp.]|nr:chitobiase/beta-hexosaminidase C-terminal domain-containing protein [Prevotella sp.]